MTIGIARTPKGRLWAVWYASPTGREDRNNYVVAVTSGDDGRTWSEAVLVIDPDRDGPVRAFDPQVWLDPDGQLWLFWAQTISIISRRGPLNGNRPKNSAACFEASDPSTANNMRSRTGTASLQINTEQGA